MQTTVPSLTSQSTGSSHAVQNQNSGSVDRSKDGRVVTPEKSSASGLLANPYIAGALTIGGGLLLGAMLGSAKVLMGSAHTGSTEIQPNPYQGLLSQQTPYFDVAFGRHLLSTACPGGASYAYSNGITGTAATGTGQGESVEIPLANGMQAVTSWVQNPTTTPSIQLSVNNADGTQARAPITLNVAGDGPVNFVSGARFANGNIAVCYGGSPSSNARVHLVVLSPDGSTIISKTIPLVFGGGHTPEVTCNPRSDGNIQVSAAMTTSYKTVEIDSSGNVVSGSAAAFAVSNGGQRAASFGQYPTGQKLFVLNDQNVGLQARVVNGATVSFTSNLIFNGEAPDSGFDQATVDTSGGPVTFWRTLEGNLHAGRVSATSGKVTGYAVDTSGSVEFAAVASSYDSRNPTHPAYLALVVDNGVSSSLQILDATTLAPIGCSTPVNGEVSSLAFYPDGQTIRIASETSSGLMVYDYDLEGTPTLVSGPTGNQTAYSNTTSTTTYTYPVEGTAPGGNEVTIYLETTNPAVTVSGNNIVVTVTPEMVGGPSFDVEYAVENPFGDLSQAQTFTVTVPDRLPVVNALEFPVAVANKYYSYELPKDTFVELDGQATTQFMDNLPQGLTYVAGTPGVSGGTISGWPLSQTADSMTEPQIFKVDVSNEQAGFTTTRAFNLTVAPSSSVADDGDKGWFRGAYVATTYALTAITVSSLLTKMAIATRIIRHQAPIKWEAHKNDSTCRRVGSVVGTCLKTLVWSHDEARKDLREKHGINLNWRGGVITPAPTGSVEMKKTKSDKGSPDHSPNKSLLTDEERRAASDSSQRSSDDDIV